MRSGLQALIISLMVFRDGAVSRGEGDGTASIAFLQAPHPWMTRPRLADPLGHLTPLYGRVSKGTKTTAVAPATKKKRTPAVLKKTAEETDKPKPKPKTKAEPKAKAKPKAKSKKSPTPKKKPKALSANTKTKMSRTKKATSLAVEPLDPSVKYLVVVESPAKVKTVESYLGPEYKAVASYGHVRSLPKKQGSVEPEEDFRMNWVISADDKVINPLLTYAPKVAHVFLASDPDREGEAIAWHVKTILQEKGGVPEDKISRVTFTELTKSAVNTAFKNPRGLDENLVDAYFARTAVDYLIGFSLSPVLWRKLPGSRSAGRVQSAALRMIAEREAAVEAFRPRSFWTVDGRLRIQTGKGKGKGKGDEKDADAEMCVEMPAKIVELDGQEVDKFFFVSEAQALDAARRIADERSRLTIKDVKKSERKRSPPAPFRTATLQQQAAASLSMGTTETMASAQRLYESGLITYMRTDGMYMSQEAADLCREEAAKRFGNAFKASYAKKYKTKAKNAQEAHEAIRPTDVRLDVTKLRRRLLKHGTARDQRGRKGKKAHAPRTGEGGDGEEEEERTTPESVAGVREEDLRLYDLIWKRSIASQMAAARHEDIRILTEVSRREEETGEKGKSEGGEETIAVLQSSFRHEIFPGFLSVYRDGGVSPSRREQSEGDDGIGGMGEDSDDSVEGESSDGGASKEGTGGGSVCVIRTDARGQPVVERDPQKAAEVLSSLLKDPSLLSGTAEGGGEVESKGGEDGNAKQSRDGDRGQVSLSVHSLGSREGKTQAPPRFTEASLVREMERTGIGRPSTYASTIRTLTERGYVERPRGTKAIVPVTRGRLVDAFLQLACDNICQTNFTASMEDNLDGIARGHRKWRPLLRRFFHPFKEQCDVAMAWQRQDVAERLEAALRRTLFGVDEVLPPSSTSSAKRSSSSSLLSSDVSEMGESDKENKGSIPATESKTQKGKSQQEEKTDLSRMKIGTGSEGQKENEKENEEEGEGGEDGVRALRRSPPCPSCKKGRLQLLVAKRGPFIGCSEYPSCTFAEPPGSPGLLSAILKASRDALQAEEEKEKGKQGEAAAENQVKADSDIDPLLGSDQSVQTDEKDEEGKAVSAHTAAEQQTETEDAESEKVEGQKEKEKQSARGVWGLFEASNGGGTAASPGTPQPGVTPLELEALDYPQYRPIHHHSWMYPKDGCEDSDGDEDRMRAAERDKMAGSASVDVRLLGMDPETNSPVSVRKGPYGHYIQWDSVMVPGKGKGDASKPKRVAMPSSADARTITLDDALQLRGYPKDLGVDPDTREPVSVGYSKRGPFLRRGKYFASIPAGADPLQLSLAEALEALDAAMQKRKGGNRYKKPPAHSREAAAQKRLADPRSLAIQPVGGGGTKRGARRRTVVK
uniref:DNA topoisomerase n=1 Tax=Chromera velia CCMP2878 TaxID=1169474 RepID=A0A0G4FKH4_9ALVE|eukprot:Cvel_3426.t1-p1 / transcript=Cvel_3426.t1 / gene=Cvel_3426 / organism=Chromera_velia_CCMP2878 / gene_product=DNA topoisomerase 1, putative / transcript_product=DNA topoisomerase 1, putative / location=Cvel_scaffold138:8607-17142(-) / protein_length=1389 / sequence_SO=supercontig / SO=protein_coding / is_pseudo=false